MKTKILCLYGNALYYGHERSNIQVFKTLNELGFDLLVLKNKNGIAPEALTVLNQSDIKHISIIYPSWDDMRKPHSLIKLIRYISKVVLHNVQFIKHFLKYQPDYIYIANDFMFLSLVPSFLFIRTKIVYRLGDAPLVGWLPFKVLWNQYITKRTYRFVCISNFIKIKLIEAGRKINNSDTIIYNYPPIRPKSSVKETNYSHSQGITFSYLGQINHGKGVHLIIDAAIEICDKIPNVNFLIAGSLDYDKVYSDALVSKVNFSMLSERILFLGAINNMEAFFEKTDVLITPSLKEEPLGNVIVEAKSFHTPSVIFKSGGMPELIAHKENGYICDSTKIGLMSAIQYYVDSPQNIKIHGQNAFDSMATLKISYLDFVNNWNSVFKS